MYVTESGSPGAPLVGVTTIVGVGSTMYIVPALVDASQVSTPPGMVQPSAFTGWFWTTLVGADETGSVALHVAFMGAVPIWVTLSQMKRAWVNGQAPSMGMNQYVIVNGDAASPWNGSVSVQPPRWPGVGSASADGEKAVATAKRTTNETTSAARRWIIGGVRRRGSRSSALIRSWIPSPPRRHIDRRKS